MPETDLIFTLTFGLGLAFVGGFIAQKLKLSPIVGYLLVGVLIGPYTPGISADMALAAQLAEIGVILLMFGVGMHFSIQDLLAVRRIALPGAILQIIVATSLGTGMALAWGWNLGAGLVLGLSLSVASTVVLLRALEERGDLLSENGSIAVGWLIVEDMVMVLMLVLLPALAGGLRGSSELSVGDLAWKIGVTIGKVGFFVLFMIVIGRRLFPWLLNQVAKTGSRELFTLFVAGVALGIAYGSAHLFGMSFALGAFFAGIVIHESHLSHRVAENALPLQDAFAVLFFVSVGMLFNPQVLLEQPLQVLGVVLVIVFGKSVAAFVLILAFRYPLNTALMVSASLAQIGEFSFILAHLGTGLGLLPVQAQSLILAGALISVALNPFTFRLAEFLERPLKSQAFCTKWQLDPLLCKLPYIDTLEKLQNHVVMVGYGRVGRIVADELSKQGIPFVIIEQNRETVEALQKKGIPSLYGDAESPEILQLANLKNARFFVVTPLDSFQARHLVNIAWELNPGIKIIVRTHNEEERRYLETMGGDLVIMGDPEMAVALSGNIVQRYHNGTV